MVRATYYQDKADVMNHLQSKGFCIKHNLNNMYTIFKKFNEILSMIYMQE